MKKTFAILVISILFVAVSKISALAEDPKPNILFIAVDDLRPELNCYGKKHIESPNIDKLAQTGMLFERSYCMVPTCGASRASLMSGLRPGQLRHAGQNGRLSEDSRLGG